MGNLKSNSSSTQNAEIYRTFLTHFAEQANGSLKAFYDLFTPAYLNAIEKPVKCYLAKDGLKSLD